jgi:hypothetical protein
MNFEKNVDSRTLTTKLLIFLVLIFSDIGLSVGVIFSDMYSKDLQSDTESINGSFESRIPF